MVRLAGGRDSRSRRPTRGAGKDVAPPGAPFGGGQRDDERMFLPHMSPFYSLRPTHRLPRGTS
jgi:hypothetical protein